MKKWLFFAVFMLVLPHISGCAELPKVNYAPSAQGVKRLDVDMALKFDDVPIPSGFVIVPNESFVFENEIVRVGVLTYKGKAAAEQVATFYKDQMPLYRWQFLNEIQYAKRTLNFDRPEQTCIIVIEEGSFSTVIRIQVAPKASRQPPAKK